VVVYSQPDDTGQVSAHLIDLAAASQVEAYPFALQSANIPRPAPDGLHLAVIDESIRVIDVVQDQSVSVGPDGRSRLSQSWGQVRWPDAPDWLILIESDGRALGGDHLWTGVMRADGEVRRRLGDCYSGSFCAVWLPARVDTTRLPAGQPASVLPEPETTIRTGHWTDELAYRPDGGQLAYLRSLPDSSQAEVIDAFSGEVLATLEDDPNRDLTWQDGRPLLAVDEREPGVLALSPAGQFRVVIPDTGYPEVQSTATGQRLLELPDYAGSQIIRFTPDSRYLLISQFSGTPVRIYSTATWELVATLNTNAQAMDVAPDGQTLAISTGWAIELYELSALLGG
jgi:WD40 repeat protein